MKAIILAAGYATRLYPLTKDRPKALLEVGSMPILDHIVENVEQIPAVDEIFIITNEKFYKHFTDWRDQRQGGLPITVYNDGTSTEDTRLGAIGDLKFTIDKGKISDDIIVLAGDNLIDFSILDFYDFYKQVDSDCVCVKKIPIEDASRMGIVQVDDNNRIVDFEEKPDKPKPVMKSPAQRSTLAA
jgi:glucose-1-phosphate thymidylyltransferase